MINAKELRIGNKVWHPNTGSVITVGYHHIRIAQLHPDENNYEPIPLTQDILEKCGFVINELGMKKVVHQGLVGYQFADNLYHRFIVGEMIFTHVLHLHELQNFYHSLTGKELNIE